MVVMVINFAITMFNAIVGAIPRIVFFEDMFKAFNACIDFFVQLSPIIPFGVLFGCLNAISLFYVSLFLFNNLKFLIHRLPFLN